MSESQITPRAGVQTSFVHSRTHCLSPTMKVDACQTTVYMIPGSRRYPYGTVGVGMKRSARGGRAL